MQSWRSEKGVALIDYSIQLALITILVLSSVYVLANKQRERICQSIGALELDTRSASDESTVIFDASSRFGRCYRIDVMDPETLLSIPQHDVF